MPEEGQQHPKTNHENSSASYTERPRGAGIGDSMRSMTAYSSLMCCGGPGRKYGKMEYFFKAGMCVA